MNNVKKSTILLICMLATASLNMAQADVVILQSLDPTLSGEFSNLGLSNQQAADDFTLSQDSILDSISWFGRYGDASVGAPNPTGFSIRLYGDSAGTPEVLSILSLSIAATPVDSGFNFDTTIPWYSYSASLPAVALGADTYWVSIVENDLGTTLSGSTQWLWADSNTNGLRSFRTSDNEDWTTSLDIDHAFSLSGAAAVPAVPVPAAVWLFGTALVGFIGVSRRRKAA